jgi:hypothetical protein
MEHEVKATHQAERVAVGGLGLDVGVDQGQLLLDVEVQLLPEKAEYVWHM